VSISPVEFPKRELGPAALFYVATTGLGNPLKPDGKHLSVKRGSQLCGERRREAKVTLGRPSEGRCHDMGLTECEEVREEQGGPLGKVLYYFMETLKKDMETLWFSGDVQTKDKMATGFTLIVLL
jgi:hypothetical protein